jgi:hypothetical protein
MRAAIVQLEAERKKHRILIILALEGSWYDPRHRKISNRINENPRFICAKGQTWYGNMAEEA